LRKLFGQAIEVFVGYCKSKLNLVKTHTFSHYEVATILFEDPSSLSTEEGEHGHKTLTKEPWRASNHRNEAIQMTKSVSRKLARERWVENFHSIAKPKRRFRFFE